MNRSTRPIYADTSFLMSCFVEDTNSSEARTRLQSLNTPLMISPLVGLEFRTALWQRVGRKELKKREAQRVLALFEKRIEEDLLVVPELAEAEAWKRAEQLSDSYVERFLLRSLDVLHVAMALVGGAKGFLTFDGRQKKLAEAAGIDVSPR